jgi:hypothetical protein
MACEWCAAAGIAAQIDSVVTQAAAKLRELRFIVSPERFRAL